MSRRIKADGMTAGERLQSKLLTWSPLLAFLLLALPLPAYFLFRYLTATENAGEYMIFALTSLGVFSVFGLVAAFAVVFYRRLWERRLRERLAADGVTAEELRWFESELSEEQRRTLREMEARKPLIAGAYRETLAARVTASRVLASARRDAQLVERRIRTAEGFQTSNRAELEEGLRKDRDRLSRVEGEAAEHLREMDSRLLFIESLASRDASEAETETALNRLGSVRENLPLGIEGLRYEQEAREEIERELRKQDEPRELPPPQSRPGT
ncbi:MAG TPA: hypothetical protein VM914_02965 [Pyrinomonadaceae bacterium]|nr:hypothetical protein [Pyrinomonadaceae bacterium]